MSQLKTHTYIHTHTSIKQTKLITCIYLFNTQSAPEVMPPILLCWAMSQAHVGDRALEVEPPLQYSTTFCCCATDGSRRAL